MKLPFFSGGGWTAAALLLASLALAWPGAARAQNVRSYQALLPDTLLPASMHSFPVAIPASNQPGTAPFDTVLLRNGGTSLALVPLNSTVGFFYQLSVPLQARPGVYDAYNKGGTLLERSVTVVADLAAKPPTLLSLSKTQGVRGMTYNVEVKAMGLAFGPIPASGPFRSDVRIAYLQRGSARIQVGFDEATSPYAMTFRIVISGQSDTGAYDLTVERSDGTKSIKPGAFRVYVPAKPEIRTVTPDSLQIGTGGILTLAGVNMEYGVQVGSFVELDRDLVRHIALRKGDIVYPASGYPTLGMGPGLALKAAFYAPFNIPGGTYDVEMAVNGRDDIALLKDAVRVISPGPLRILSVTPSHAGRVLTRLEITLANYFGPSASLAFTLVKGGARIPGSQYGREEHTFQVDFDLAGADSGSYELLIGGLTSPLSLPGALRVGPPAIGRIQPPRLMAASIAELGVGILSRDFEMEIISNPGMPASLTNRVPNIRRASLCRGGDCVEGRATVWRGEEVGISFTAPIGQPAGVYDLELTTLTPVLKLLRKSAVLIAPLNHEPLTPEDGAASHWTVAADSLLRLDLRAAGSTCPGDAYTLDQAPSGMLLSGGVLAWRPRPADTGWNHVSVQQQPGCPFGAFLAIRVEPKPGVAIRRETALPAGAASPGLMAGSFRISLDQPASLELHGLDGRMVARFPELEAGVHLLPLPAASGRGVLLCRVRGGGGESWLRLALLP